ncbi:3-keto-disaccharide hydrolase [Mariniblastus fucicola]|uniref:3-keto-alpha-glucoside-1,2-lyase/3-keto-2-hydroxy-glucal hydratase domain-containing protein n=1 Tax=Mariniblastus fucicola TaxID=980251 RepID=A0A5B9PDY1_9BACT|nr:DUF1080 domain-containing protein [Mariniblastus fucicola]QEG24494.1 hypothetical protein MFFC18_44140 [Mariniblastus fucicola]
MIRVLTTAFAVCLFASCAVAQDAEFKSMFNGKNLLGWHVNESPESVYIEDGCIVTHGERAHAFYVGETGHADFSDFHFKCKVKTKPQANSGIYFHTKFEATGWPSEGYEAQVNNTQSDPKKTGGLYGVKDCFEAPAKDDVWFDYEIMVEGKHVVIKIDGKVISDYTEPENPERAGNMTKRLIGSGTMALQAHDPGSKVYYKDLMLKILN